LKTRAEIAALKAEEEDKGKKKGKRSARSRTPKSGKKSAAEKKGICLKGNFFQCHVFAMKSVQNLKCFWRSSQNYFVLALFSNL
jgi:hypothetical protein